MTEYVKLYLGPRSDMKGKDEEFIHLAEFISAEPGDYPADIPRYYNLEVTVRSKVDGYKYEGEIDSRRINNWLRRFENILKEELDSDDGLDGRYEGKQRNVKILKILSNLVPIWVNTKRFSRKD